MIVTFIRHGESVDNLKTIWAGWKDAPLSNHGMNQARALGNHWILTPITSVYCSDLKRAHTTALQLVAPRTGKDALTPIVNPLLREQNFGVAEGKGWAAHPPVSGENETEEEVYYTIYNRHDKFAEGESLDDLAARVDKALDETLWPHVEEALKNGGHESVHIVLVSHGLAISEMVSALLRRSPKPPAGNLSYKGLANTGWSQVQIEIHHRAPPQQAEREITNIHVVCVNKCPHLTDLKRQAGGIGSSAHDEKQTSIKDFFGGGGGAVNNSVTKENDGEESDHGASTSV